jgi:hypothetical protein
MNPETFDTFQRIEVLKSKDRINKIYMINRITRHVCHALPEITLSLRGACGTSIGEIL